MSITTWKPNLPMQTIGELYGRRMRLLPAEFRQAMLTAIGQGTDLHDVVDMIVGYARTDTTPITPGDRIRVMEGLREAGVR